MAFKLKASRVLAMVIFLFSLFDSFRFSTFEIVFLAGIAQLIFWSGTLGLFLFNSLNCNSGLVLLCFLLRRTFFRFTILPLFRHFA